MEALGAEYDSDPRLGVLQVGLIGFWGEWHTYPHVAWFPTLETQTTLLNAVHSAFPTTVVQVRQPHANSPDLPMGYHDDSFAYSTLGTVGWFFWNQLIAAGETEKWKTAMMGGEVRPEDCGTVVSRPAMASGNTPRMWWSASRRPIRATCSIIWRSTRMESATRVWNRKRRKQQLAMGYQLEVSGAELTVGSMSGNTVEATVNLTVSNTGIAPFYYDLTVGVSDLETKPLGESEANLKGLLPGEQDSHHPHGVPSCFDPSHQGANGVAIQPSSTRANGGMGHHLSLDHRTRIGSGLGNQLPGRSPTSIGCVLGDGTGDLSVPMRCGRDGSGLFGRGVSPIEVQVLLTFVGASRMTEADSARNVYP